MKLFLISLLCGVVAIVCCRESPQCSDNDLMQCYSYREKPLVETEEDLDNYCRELECLLEFHNSCGSKYSSMSKGEYTHNDNVYGALCFKKHHTRQAFLKNAECLNTVIEPVAAICRKNDDIETDHKKFCKDLSEAMECADTVVTRKCGKDASEVFSIIYPGNDYFECKS